jgi:hypothetical protein
LNRVSTSFHIKLNESKFNLIYDKYSTLEKYLVNLNTTPRFTAVFNIPVYSTTDNSLSYLDRNFIWSSKDGFNKTPFPPDPVTNIYLSICEHCLFHFC